MSERVSDELPMDRTARRDGDEWRLEVIPPGTNTDDITVADREKGFTCSRCGQPIGKGPLWMRLISWEILCADCHSKDGVA